MYTKHSTVRPLRIVMLAPFGIRPKGTLLARMLPIAQVLVARGHTVVIIAPAVQNPEDAGTTVDYNGVRVIHTPRPRTPGLFGVVEQVGMLMRSAMHEKPDLIHLFKPKGLSGLAALGLQYLNKHVPLVVDTDDWEGWGGWNNALPYPTTAKWLFAWQEWDLPRRATAVTVASRTLQTQVWSFGVPPNRVVYVPNGVGRISQHKPHEKRAQPTLLLYTRFWEFSLAPFMQMLVAITQQRPDVQLLVIGKGERGEEQTLLQQAERAGIQTHIDYRGWVTPDNIKALLQSADIALAPLDDTLINRARGMAKLLELMQAGLPIVAHTVGAAAEYINETSGALVPPGDNAAFVYAVLQLLADSKQRQQLGEGAQKRVHELFRWERLASEVERAYVLALDESFAIIAR